MSVLENEFSVVSREMDTTEAGEGKGVAPGPRYEVVTDSVDKPAKVFKPFNKPGLKCGKRCIRKMRLQT